MSGKLGRHTAQHWLGPGHKSFDLVSHGYLHVVLYILISRLLQKSEVPEDWVTGLWKALIRRSSGETLPVARRHRWEIIKSNPMLNHNWDPISGGCAGGDTVTRVWAQLWVASVRVLPLRAPLFSILHIHRAYTQAPATDTLTATVEWTRLTMCFLPLPLYFNTRQEIWPLPA